MKYKKFVENNDVRSDLCPIGQGFHHNCKKCLNNPRTHRMQTRRVAENNDCPAIYASSNCSVVRNELPPGRASPREPPSNVSSEQRTVAAVVPAGYRQFLSELRSALKSGLFRKILSRWKNMVERPPRRRPGDGFGFNASG